MKNKILTLSIIILLFSVVWAEESSTIIPKKNSFGLGFGIPYGVLGTNIDVNIKSNLNGSAGIGTTIFAGIGYNIGIKYFLASFEHKFRPRISFYYGINALSVIDAYVYTDQGLCIGTKEEKKTYSGFSAGFGAQWMWGKSKSNGLDFDLIYVVTSSFDKNKLRERASEYTEFDDLNRIKISIGYRHSF